MTTLASLLSPFQLLEINLITAQDLAKVSRNLRTYAVAWVHPDRKLTTRVDTHGGTNPTWNDKFVFRVDEGFLRSDTSAVMIEIYALHWFRDVHVGTVRVLVSNLIPPQAWSGDDQQHRNQLGMRFVALQVRRQSGRPQGILNVGVTVLDSSMRSMPLYTQLSTSALGYQHLMGTEDLHHNSHDQNHGNGGSSSAAVTMAAETGRGKLRRTKSERSSMMGIDDEEEELIYHHHHPHHPHPHPVPKSSSIRGGGSAAIKSSTAKKGKFLQYDRPLSIVDGASDLAVQLDVMNTARAKSTLSQSSIGPTSRTRSRSITKAHKAASITSLSDLGSIPAKPLGTTTTNNIKKIPGSDIGAPTRPNIPRPKHNWLEPNKPHHHQKSYPISKDFANGSVWSESEVGPSPSEVAAAIAEDNRYRQFDDGRKWIADGSEGLQTKLDRWRAELPSLYDYSSFTSTAFAPRHNRRHTDAGAGGKFSCFGNIGGYECSIVCGRSAPKRRADGGAGKKRLARSPSLDSMSTYI